MPVKKTLLVEVGGILSVAGADHNANWFYYCLSVSADNQHWKFAATIENDEQYLTVAKMYSDLSLWPCCRVALCVQCSCRSAIVL